MNLDLRTYSTFHLGGTAHKVFEIHTQSDIKDVLEYADKVQKPLIVLGEGSNSIFADTQDTYIIALMKITGIETIAETDSSVTLRVGGGVMWDEFVAHTVDKGYAGAEALSLIPGTVGASPIQNIGAYGSDVSKIITEVEVYNRESNQIEKFSNAQCDFSYRDSIFKKEQNKYIITHVTFVLSKLPPQVPQYKDVLEYFSQNVCHSREGGNPGSQNPNIEKSLNPSIKQIRDAIIHIRTSKLPDYKTEYNCGSFFKNPLITKEHLESLKKSFPDIPSFEISEDTYKVFAGWIIEHVEYTSAQTENFYFYSQNKLALVHTGKGTFTEFETVIKNITKLVHDAFEITLEMEPIVFE